MKKLILLFPALLFFATLCAQDTTMTIKVPAKHTQQIKVGASIQYDISNNYDYDYYPYYDYYGSYHNRALSNYEGPNTMVFIAYEHIWTYANNMSVGIEPKLGFTFREYLSNGFVGANWKFYWIDKEYWRMGIYLFTAYEYDQGTRTIEVRKDNGMYSQRLEVELNQHVFSAEVGMTLFQVTLRNAPVVLELNASLLGMHVYKTTSEKYDIGDGNTDRYKSSDVNPYGPKIELKVGWKIK